MLAKFALTRSFLAVFRSLGRCIRARAPIQIFILNKQFRLPTERMAKTLCNSNMATLHIQIKIGLFACQFDVHNYRLHNFHSFSVLIWFGYSVGAWSGVMFKMNCFGLDELISWTLIGCVRLIAHRWHFYRHVSFSIFPTTQFLFRSFIIVVAVCRPAT